MKTVISARAAATVGDIQLVEVYNTIQYNIRLIDSKLTYRNR